MCYRVFPHTNFNTYFWGCFEKVNKILMCFEQVSTQGIDTIFHTNAYIFHPFCQSVTKLFFFRNKFRTSRQNVWKPPLRFRSFTSGIRQRKLAIWEKIVRRTYSDRHRTIPILFVERKNWH